MRVALLDTWDQNALASVMGGRAKGRESGPEVPGLMTPEWTSIRKIDSKSFSHTCSDNFSHPLPTLVPTQSFHCIVKQSEKWEGEEHALSLNSSKRTLKAPSMGAHATSSIGLTVSPSVASKNVAPFAFSLHPPPRTAPSPPHLTVCAYPTEHTLRLSKSVPPFHTQADL